MLHSGQAHDPWTSHTSGGASRALCKHTDVCVWQGEISLSDTELFHSELGFFSAKSFSHFSYEYACFYWTSHFYVLFIGLGGQTFKEFMP